MSDTSGRREEAQDSGRPGSHMETVSRRGEGPSQML